MSFIEPYTQSELRPEYVGESLRLKPLLATAWGRALVAGILVGTMPVVLVSWIYFDQQLLGKSNEQEIAQWAFLRSIGILGDALPWLCVSGSFILIGFLCKRRDIVAWAGFACLSIALSGVVVNLVKFIFMRNRPNWQGVIPDGGSFAFPSGHASTICAVATVLILRWPKIFPVALVLVALVAMNRIVSLNHHLTDVIVGVVLGLVSTFVVQWCWWKYNPGTFADME
ncbi:MAG: phosphatase PAP2 family protein [Phycisphaerales bacterium]|nr:phosphatase PAP2 family protein [Phycisphaerales bacterium]